jgi:hypothetical protein
MILPLPNETLLSFFKAVVSVVVGGGGGGGVRLLLSFCRLRKKIKKKRKML